MGSKSDDFCKWKYNGESVSVDDFDGYETSCGGLFHIIEGTPSENRMIFCPYCGKKIKSIYMIVCPKCDGIGEIEHWYAEREFGFEPCDKCNGTGNIKEIKE